MTKAKINICCVTGTRADYGHQLPLFKRLIASEHFNFHLLVTGSHLEHDFGYTIDQIRADSVPIARELKILDSDDSALGVAQSMSRAVSGLAKCLDELKPDVMVLFGDRYEILAAAQCGLVMGIPMVHIGGGDITEGAYDNSIRHALTKFSSLHFPTNEEAKRRIVAMGEIEDHVVNVGSLCIDSIQETRKLSREQLASELAFTFKRQNLLVTYHPETTGSRHAIDDVKQVFAALSEFKDVGIIITKPSLDVEGMHLIREMEHYAEQCDNMKIFSSLGQVKYYSLLNIVDAVVGNSSSGLYEVPSFKKPTVNIGDRQKGRLAADSVLHCRVDKKAIIKSIEDALAHDCHHTVNPYGDGKTAERIEKLILEKFDNIKKRKVEYYRGV